MLAFTIALFPVRGLLDCYTFFRDTWTCIPADGCINQRACFAYRWISYSISNGSGVVSLVMYIFLFRKARKLRNRVAVATPSEAATSETEREEMARRMKHERKANITFFLLFLALIGVSIPPSVFVLIGRIFVIISGKALPTAYTVTEVLVGPTISLLILIDPIVIMRNQDFREVIRMLFRVQSSTS